MRMWHNGEVQVYYLNSFALGHARAEDILSHFWESPKVISQKKLIQVAMDGPNVNWSIMTKLRAELATYSSMPLKIDNGSCGLHTVHLVFKTGLNTDPSDKNVCRFRRLLSGLCDAKQFCE